MRITKKKVLTLFSIILLLFCGVFSQAQIHPDIISSIKKGDSKKLAEYFSQNIEMELLGKNNVYSKPQAQQIIGKFFSANTPESFTVISDEIKKNDRNIFGTLKTRTGTFRIYMLLKKGEDKIEYIHLLKIDKR